jgi:4-amino-4-deoxy-L-arabinose transferase-like glycosyltransferase
MATSTPVQSRFVLRPALPRRIGLALLLFAVLACAAGLIAFSHEASASHGWAPYLSSIVLSIAGCYFLIPYRRAQTGPAFPDRGELAIGALILCLAAFMRFYRFDTVPFGTWFDEADIGLVAKHILTDHSYRPFFVASNDHPLHFFSLVALSFHFFGVSTESIRLVTVTFGLLTVVLAFLAGREAFGNRFGLLLAFCFAIARWHVTFSRFGVYTITLPWLALITIWLLLRARRTGQVHDFAWAGLAFGLGLCFYMAGRLIAVVVGLYFLQWIITAGRSNRDDPKVPRRVLWGGVAAFSLAGWFAVAPLAQFAVTHPAVYWGRVAQVSLFQRRDEANLAKALYHNTVKHLAMFNYRGDNNGRHNLPGEPMLDPAMGVLFILGLGLAVSRAGHSTHFLMLILFAVGMMGGILTVDFEAPQSNRALGAIVAVLYFVALAVETLWRRLDRSRLALQGRRAVSATVLLAAGSYMVYFNGETFFVRQARNDRVWLEYCGQESLAAYRMREADPRRTSLYASSFLNNHRVIQFLTPEAAASQSLTAPIGLPIRESGDRPVAIIADPDNMWIVNEVRQFYPRAQVRLDARPSGTPALYSMRISREELRRLHGSTAHYWRGDSAGGPPVAASNGMALAATWPGDAPVLLPFVAQFEATLYAPRYGQYELILKSPAHAAMWLDERQVLRGHGEQRLMWKLAEGDHALRVEAAGGHGPVTLQWRQPDASGIATGNPSDIPSSSVYLPSLVPVQGLLGTYYSNESWSGPESFSRVDPFLDMYIHVIPLPRPYTVDWTGQIDLPAGGEWKFGLRVVGQAELAIDDRTVVKADHPGGDLEGKISLAQGRHRIRIHFLDDMGSSRIHLSWTPPGGAQQIVPREALLPYG